jgi:hypothetical protein
MSIFVVSGIVGVFLKLYTDNRIEITNVKITNVTATSATLVYTTEKPFLSKVIYESGKKPSSLTSQISFDDRNQEMQENFEMKKVTDKKFQTHHVTLQNLDPETEYFVGVRKGWVVDRSFPSFTTKKISDNIASPEPVYGFVEVLDKDTKLNDGVVVVSLGNDETDLREYVSKPIFDNSYSVDISSLENLPNQDIHIEAIVEVDEEIATQSFMADSSQLQPVERIVLSTGVESPQVEQVFVSEDLKDWKTYCFVENEGWNFEKALKGFGEDGWCMCCSMAAEEKLPDGQTIRQACQAQQYKERCQDKKGTQPPWAFRNKNQNDKEISQMTDKLLNSIVSQGEIGQEGDLLRSGRKVVARQIIQNKEDSLTNCRIDHILAMNEDHSCPDNAHICLSQSDRELCTCDEGYYLDNEGNSATWKCEKISEPWECNRLGLVVNDRGKCVQSLCGDSNILSVLPQGLSDVCPENSRMCVIDGTDLTRCTCRDGFYLSEKNGEEKCEGISSFQDCEKLGLAIDEHGRCVESYCRDGHTLSILPRVQIMSGELISNSCPEYSHMCVIRGTVVTRCSCNEGYSINVEGEKCEQSSIEDTMVQPQSLFKQCEQDLIVKRATQPNTTISCDEGTFECVVAQSSQGVLLGCETPRRTKNFPDRNIDITVMVIVFNPSIGSKKLNIHYNWQDPRTLTNEIVDYWGDTSQGKVNYKIGEVIEVDEFPLLEGGFKFDADSYKACREQREGCPDSMLDYEGLLSQYNVCEKANATDGLFELWLWGAPYFGFWESSMAGPNAFYINGGVITDTNCNKLVPIMGFSYERYLEQAVHNYGHRTEYGLAGLYKTSPIGAVPLKNIYDRFIYTPGFYAVHGTKQRPWGCGNIHYPPNSDRDCIYSIKSNELSYCGLGDLDANLVAPINCDAWGCAELGYYVFWFQHFPDPKWWEYVFDPQTVVNNRNVPVGTESDFGKKRVGTQVFASEVYTPDETEENLRRIEAGGYELIGDSIGSQSVLLEKDGHLAFFYDTNGNGVMDEEESYLSDEEMDQMMRQIKVNPTAEAQKYSLQVGWNMFSFPLLMEGEGTSQVKDAKGLIEKLNQQTAHATHLATYRSGQFLVYTNREDAEGTQYSFGGNFNLIPGEAYFVKNYRKTEVNLVGRKVDGSLEILLEPGWNMRGIYNSSKEDITGFEVLNDMGKQINASILSKYENGAYENLVIDGEVEYGNDFQIFPTHGYWIRSSENKSRKYAP